MFLLFFGFILLTFLLSLAIIDFRTFKLPNILTIPLIILGLSFSLILGTFPNSVIGMSVAYLSFVGLELLYKHIRKMDGLGRGDAKLFAVGGAWCGWYGLPFIILIASASGLGHAVLISRKKKTAQGSQNKIQHIPFGPHLSLGIFMVWLSMFAIPNSLFQ